MQVGSPHKSSLCFRNFCSVVCVCGGGSIQTSMIKVIKKKMPLKTAFGLHGQGGVFWSGRDIPVSR